MNKYLFHVSGTHCPSCKILIEDVLSEQDFIQNARVNLRKELVEIETVSDKSPEEIVSILNRKVEPNGYVFSVGKIISARSASHNHAGGEEKKVNNVLWQAIPIGLVFLVLFFLLQKSGILNVGIGGKMTPVTGFIIGIIASLSSCLAIVGGLILSLSAKVAKNNGGTKKPIILFHAGRLIGFAVLGGVLGLIGEAIGINFLFSAILGLLASSVMIILGFNLLGIFKKNRMTLPSGIFGFFRKAEHTTWAPVLVGLGTFFLPCGFTQSMQISALSSGSFLSGFSIMLSFALGTLPVLGILSFGSISFSRSKYASLFFKSAGVVVVGLGIFAFLSGLAGIGLINPLFSL